MANKKDETANRKIKEIVVRKKDVPEDILKNIEMGLKAYSMIIPMYNYTMLCVGDKALNSKSSEHRTFCIDDKEYHDEASGRMFRKLWRYDIKRRRYYAPNTTPAMMPDTTECRS